MSDKINCMRCNEKVTPKNVTTKITSKNQPYLSGSCPKCGKTITKFISKAGAKPKASSETIPLVKPKLVRTKKAKKVVPDETD